MILVYFLLFIIFLLMCLNINDWMNDVKTQKQHDEMTKNFQKLHDSWRQK